MSVQTATYPRIAPTRPTDRLPPWGYLEWFVVLQTALGILSFIPGLGPFRLLVRILPFATAFLPFFMRSPFRKTPLPAEGLLIGVMVVYAVAFFHPQTNSFMSGVAQVGLNLAIIAPAFWGPQMIYGPRQIRRLLVILLVVCGIDSGVGILQVYNPQRYIPADLLAQMEDLKANGRVYQGADGQDIMRPPGLSNNPGAACASGMLGGLLAISFLLGRTALLLRLYCLATLFLGTAVIYMSMVRTALLVMCGMCVVLCLLNVLQGRVGKAVLVLAVAAGGCVAGLIYAVALGGDAVEARYSTIVDQNPASLYYNSRGAGVQQTFTTTIFEYPVGAGLARWGQMRSYFGDESNTNSPPLFAEIQFPCWILDGGFALLLLYVIAIVSTLRMEIHLARTARDPELQSIAATICALSCGLASMCFSFVPFVCQFGVIFWLLAGVLYGASKRVK